MGEAVRLLVGEGHVDHIDLNICMPGAQDHAPRRGLGVDVLGPLLLEALVRAAVDGDIGEHVANPGAGHDEVPPWASTTIC